MTNNVKGRGTSRHVSTLKRVAVSLAFATTLIVSGSASAELVLLEWDGTVTNVGDWPAALGDKVKVTFSVDNGQTGTLSQTWGVSHFKRLEIVGDNWVYEGWSIDKFGSSGIFSTDAAGAVTPQGDWQDRGNGDPNVRLNGGLQFGEWFITSTQLYAYYDTYTKDLNVRDTTGGGVANRWTARTYFEPPVVAAVPEASTYALMGFGFLGLAGLRRRQNKA